jgi:hypothetical protein
MLNIIIFREENSLKDNKDIGNQINFKKLIQLGSFDEIKHNDNFNDIINTKSVQLEYLKIISIVYDIIVKYYYIPNELSNFEEKICNSYWMKILEDLESNTHEYKFLEKHLGELKDSYFLKDIKKLISFKFKIEDNISNNKNTINEYITNKKFNLLNDYFDILNDNKEDNEEISLNMNKTINEDFEEVNIFDKEILKTQNNIIKQEEPVLEFNNFVKEVKIIKGIYSYMELKEECLKLFLIWNTIFIIFFRKNFKYVRFLESISLSSKLINDYKTSGKNFYKENICCNSAFIYLFTSFFFLDKLANQSNEESTSKIGKIFKSRRIDVYINKLNTFLNLNKIEKLEILSPHNLFFKDISHYIFSGDDLNFEKNLFKNNSECLNKYHFDNRFESFYPSIFINLWSDFDFHIKKTLFFGLSKLFQQTGFDISICSKKEYYNNIINELSSPREDSVCFKIDRFMTSEHRSHFFYILKFPDEDFIEIKRMIHKKLDDKIPSEFLKKKSFEEIFKFITDTNIKIGTVYEIYNIIFDKLFTNLKKNIIKLIDKHNDLFSELLKDNIKFFECKKARIKFVKFFKYVLTMKKFNLITGIMFYFLLFNFRIFQTECDC